MHLSETMLVGILSLGAIIVGAIIAGAKADGKRGAQLEQVLKNQDAHTAALTGVVEEVGVVKSQANATERAVAVHTEQIAHHREMLSQHREQIANLESAAARAQRHMG